MNALKLRANAYETGYALDQKQQFLAGARRDRKVGEWAAGMLGKTDAEAYADEIVVSGLERRDGVISRLRRDFDAAGVAVADDEIQSRMGDLLRDVLSDMRAA